MRHAAGLCIFVLLALGTACGGPDNQPTQVNPPPSPSIQLVSSEPSTGGTTTVGSVDGGGIALNLASARLVFSVVSPEELPDGKLEVDLLADDGTQCWFTFIEHPVAARVAKEIVVPGASLISDGRSPSCATFPQHVATVKATLLTLRGPEVNGRLQRTDYLAQSFSLPFTIERYPPPPAGAPQSPPAIAALSWSVPVIPTGGDPPMSGDGVSATCTVREADGAPMTVALTFTWDGFPAKRVTMDFPAGAASSSEGAVAFAGDTAPNVPSRLPHAVLDCVATNARGETTRKAIDIGVKR